MTRLRKDFSSLEHAMELFPVKAGDCPEALTIKAVKAWLNAGPKRIIGPERIALLRGMFVGAVLRAGGDVADAQVAAGSHIMQGWATQSRLMKERS